MKKAKLSELFKDGENFQFGKVDYESEEVQKEIEEVVKQQQEVLDSMKVNLNDLRKITFDI
jgi:hypothetical protein